MEAESSDLSCSFDLLQILTDKVEEFMLRMDVNDETTGEKDKNKNNHHSPLTVRSILYDLQIIIDQANENLGSELNDRYSRSLNGIKRIKINSAGPGKENQPRSILMDKNIQEQTRLDELANEDVLSLIFLHMGFQDLLNFRLVSHKWRSAASSTLLKRNMCQITLTRKFQRADSLVDSLYGPPISSCQYYSDKVRDQNHDPCSLRVLNNLIQNSSKFPCKNFRFIDENNDSLCLATSKSNRSKTTSMKMDSEIRKLFSIFGPEIVSISFNGTLFQSDLRHILVNRAPNLETLDLTSLENLITSRSKNLFPPEELFNFNLRLTTLRLGSPFFLDPQQTENTLQELLAAAPNLRGIYNVRMWCLKPLVRCNKVYLIKDLDFDPGADPDDIELIQEFALCEPRLHRLSVNFTYVSSLKRFWPCVVQVLNSILKASKDTLEFLEIHPLGKIRLVKEVLTKCKVLRIGDDYGHYGYGGAVDTPEVSDEDSEEDSDAERNNDNKILPQNVSFAHNFPHLETIQLDLQYLDEDSVNFYFPVYNCQAAASASVPITVSEAGSLVPSPSTSVTVKNLEIYNDWPDYLCTRILSKRFPHLKSLKLACYHASDLSESIWQWQSCDHLESIEIYGVSNGGVGEPVGVPPSIIDSFFTGIPVETCRELRMKRFHNITSQEIDSMRVKSSICDMKHLRRFKIIFMELRAPFISHVSGFYAFQLMTQLEITFAYDQSQKYSKVAKETERHLEAVAPFVNLIHHKKPTPFSRTLE